jgi:hypothetical protein
MQQAAEGLNVTKAAARVNLAIAARSDQLGVCRV